MTGLEYAFSLVVLLPLAWPFVILSLFVPAAIVGIVFGALALAGIIVGASGAAAENTPVRRHALGGA